MLASGGALVVAARRLRRTPVQPALSNPVRGGRLLRAADADYTRAMTTALRIATRLTVLLLLAASLAACGNKGDLVKPTPPADKPVGA
jgi:predicted small lipoprotein YifL